MLETGESKQKKSKKKTLKIFKKISIRYKADENVDEKIEKKNRE